MIDQQYDRHLQSIAKWYFIKFYEYVYLPPVDAGFLVANEPMLRFRIQEHYKRNKRKEYVNVEGLRIRENRIVNLMKKSEMENTLKHLINNTKSRVLVDEARRVYELVHHQAYVG
jgi:hypothetical protein